MKPIIPSMPFLAFPTEKVLSEFQPVRGLLVETPAPDLADRREPRAFQRVGDLTDLHDPRPLLAAICREMGYSADLVAAGEGETGVPGHAWFTYCDETWLPMLVRWQAGEAQLVLTLVETHHRGGAPDLRLAILGDAAALPILRRLAVALTPFHLARPSLCEGPVAVDGKSRPLGIPEIAFSRFGITGLVQGDASGRLGAERTDGLADLARSCNLSAARLDPDARMRPDELHLWFQHGRPPGVMLAPDRRLAPELVDLIQRQSVEDVRRLVTEDLGLRFGPPLPFIRPRSLLIGVEQQTPAVIAQRLHLAGIIHEIEHMPVGIDRLFGRPFGTFHLALHATSLGEAFRRPEDEVLAGTEHRAYEQAGGTGLDLLSLGILAVEFTLKHLGSDAAATELRNPPKRGVAIPELADLRRAPGAPRARLVPVEKPSYGFLHGLPVRVDKRVLVWRADDTRALAIDFAATGAGTHLASLSRVPVPVKIG
jgi:hypothetical protein